MTRFFSMAGIGLAVALMAGWALVPGAGGQAVEYVLHDSHHHLTNYIQEGPDLEEMLDLMGDKVGRVALFGIPLQQTWEYRNSGDDAPQYYLQSDSPLYYYSFTDAYIATLYNALSPEQQARFDPMITGFNPADMYGVDHIRRVLETFPGVFSGIGEFTIHKEFVSGKIAGEIASLDDPALDRILEFAAETGLLVLVHCDVDVPFQKPDVEPRYLRQMKRALTRNPGATVIWAHMGLGRVVHPSVRSEHTSELGERSTIPFMLLEEGLADPNYDNLYHDISWDEVAKWVVADPETTQAVADIINKYPDRILYGSDAVAPADEGMLLKTYEMYAPLWKLLTPEALEMVLKTNHERLFDAAATRVRAWERENVR
jgi:hypothetical protein